MASSLPINDYCRSNHFLAIEIKSGNRADAGTVNHLTPLVEKRVKIDGETSTNTGDNGDGLGET